VPDVVFDANGAAAAAADVEDAEEVAKGAPHGCSSTSPKSSFSGPDMEACEKEIAIRVNELRISDTVALDAVI
jgi:hypothetical protein